MVNKFQSNLFKNIVIHHRLFPFNHRFKYSVFSFFIDYDELKLLDKNITFFSYNKFNFFSFHEQDHGYRDNRSLKKFVESFLRKKNIYYKNLKIKILCFPRILGYVFNPLSVIFCFDSGKLLSIFYEVKNTFNEQHIYCFANKKSALKQTYQQRCRKIFYVSPFIQMNCYYKFLTKIPKDQLSLLIEQFDENDKKILIASQVGKKIDFSSFTLIKFFFIYPLLTIKIIFSIHYQAINILFKGGKRHIHLKKNKDTLSFEGKL